jgi:hypothetical protein
MNERIQKLEKQCWSHYIDGVLIDGHLHFDTQKFNKLIIQDCIQTLRSNGYDDAAQCLQDINFGLDHPI